MGPLYLDDLPRLMWISPAEAIYYLIQKDRTCSVAQLHSQPDDVSPFQWYFGGEVCPTEGDSQTRRNKEHFIERRRPSAFPRLSHFHLERLKNLERIVGLEYLPTLATLILKDLPQLKHVSGTALSSKVSWIAIHRCPMLEEMPRLQYVEDSYPSLLLEECGAMEALWVEDDFKTCLSRKMNHAVKGFRFGIFCCKFGSMEELERWA
jgi:hypothetical protein